MKCFAKLALLGGTLLGGWTQVTSAAPASSSAFCVPQVVTPWEQTKLFQDFVDTFYVKKDIPTAFHTYVAANYIQHNPFILSGPQPAIDFLTPLFPKSTIELYHVSNVDANIAWVHFRGSGTIFGNETAVVDVYRFNGSCVVEHWDVIEAKPANATNPLALF